MRSSCWLSLKATNKWANILSATGVQLDSVPSVPFVFRGHASGNSSYNPHESRVLEPSAKLTNVTKCVV